MKGLSSVDPIFPLVCLVMRQSLNTNPAPGAALTLSLYILSKLKSLILSLFPSFSPFFVSWAFLVFKMYYKWMELENIFLSSE
jgi:hypothetical protein